MLFIGRKKVRQRSCLVWLLLAWLGVMLSAPLACQAAEADDSSKAEVELRYFAPKIGGSFAKGQDYHSFRSGEDALDLNDDLGLDGASAPEVKLTWDGWSVDYMRISSDVNDFRLSGQIRHKDHFYKGNLDTEMKVDYMTIEHQWPISRSESASYHWSAGAKIFRVDATSTGINEYDQPQSDTDSTSGIVPSLGIGASWRSPGAERWRANVGVSGIYLGGHGRVLDMEAGVSYHPDEQWRISAGYRRLDMDLHYNDTDVSFQATGPFFGVTCSF